MAYKLSKTRANEDELLCITRGSAPVYVVECTQMSHGTRVDERCAWQCLCICLLALPLYMSISTASVYVY